MMDPQQIQRQANLLRDMASSSRLSQHLKLRRDGSVVARKSGEVLFYVEREGRRWHPLGVAFWLEDYPSRQEACRIALRSRAQILEMLALGKPLCGSCTYYFTDPAANCGGTCSNQENPWADCYLDETCFYHDSEMHDASLCCLCEDEPCGRGAK